MLRDTLSAAAGLEQAILATAPLAPPAIRGEITDLATRIENGDRLAPSLRRLADQLADPTGDLVIAALVLAAEQQARQLGDLLGSLAHAAREQASMRMRVEAGRARTRTSVRVIVGTTLCFAVAVVVLNRSYLSAYDSAVGQVVLLGIGVLFSLGFAWLVRIAQVAEPDTLPVPDRRHGREAERARHRKAGVTHRDHRTRAGSWTRRRPVGAGGVAVPAASRSRRGAGPHHSAASAATDPGHRGHRLGGQARPSVHRAAARARPAR